MDVNLDLFKKAARSMTDCFLTLRSFRYGQSFSLKQQLCCLTHDIEPDLVADAGRDCLCFINSFMSELLLGGGFYGLMLVLIGIRYEKVKIVPVQLEPGSGNLVHRHPRLLSQECLASHD